MCSGFACFLFGFCHSFNLDRNSMSTKKILVIDDDPDILDAVQMLLESEGYIVTTFSKGEEVDKLNGDLPDLILLDVLLSGNDGRNISKKLKNQTRTPHIPTAII